VACAAALRRARASSARRLGDAQRRLGDAVRRGAASGEGQLGEAARDAQRRLGDAVHRSAAPGGGQLGDAARRRCAAPGGGAARRCAAPGDGGAMTSREGGVDDGSSGVAHPARPARTGSAHDRGWLKAR
jgi:hypothetical protein